MNNSSSVQDAYERKLFFFSSYYNEHDRAQNYWAGCHKHWTNFEHYMPIRHRSITVSWTSNCIFLWQCFISKVQLVVLTEVFCKSMGIIFFGYIFIALPLNERGKNVPSWQAQIFYYFKMWMNMGPHSWIGLPLCFYTRNDDPIQIEKESYLFYVLEYLKALGSLCEIFKGVELETKIRNVWKLIGRILPKS